MRSGSLPERRRRRIRHRVLLAAATLALAGCGSEAQEPRGPNVLLVSIDTLRADHLAAYGYERETAPALTRLAREGVRFENAYAQSSSTVPTHASLFTGRFPFEHGAYHVGLAVREDERTLAELFSEVGYRTFAAASSVRFRGNTGFDQGFDVFERFDELEKNDRSQALTDRALEWISEAGEPWFAFLHYFDPHQPYAPPEPWRSRWHAGLPMPRPEATSDYLYFHDGPDRPVPPDVLDYLLALYDGEIRFLDVQLARLFEGLSPEPGTPGTLVVVTSDHGEEFKEHGGLSHARRLHEELLRVPLLIWWPGRVTAGTVVRSPVQTVDVLPTLLDLAGLDPLALLRRASGRSRAAEVQAAGPLDPGSALPPANPVFAQVSHLRWALTADIAGGRFKYVSRDDAPHRLFDLRVDPNERNDLSATRADVAAKLREMAVALGADAPHEGPARVEPVDPEIRERLREIGYVEEADES